MGIFSKLEGKMEDTLEGAAGMMAGSSLSPVQIAKKAEKQMRREKMVGAGKQYAPTLYSVLVSAEDDDRLFGYYPTLAGEIETYLNAKANEHGLVMDGQPLVRFIVNERLKRGKFDVIAEAVSAPIVHQLRQEEMERYGIYDDYDSYGGYDQQRRYDRYDGRAASYAAGEKARPADQSEQRKPPLPYVPEDEIDYSIDYGEYTFDSRNFEDYRDEEEYAQDAAHQPATMVFSEESASPANQRGAAGARRRSEPSLVLMDLATKQRFPLGKSVMLIGRETSNDIVLSDASASRTHAELRLEGPGAWALCDLDSTNGTFVNGREISVCPLREGDRITIGLTTLVFMRA